MRRFASTILFRLLQLPEAFGLVSVLAFTAGFLTGYLVFEAKRTCGDKTVALLSEVIPIPDPDDVSATPHGEVDFDWETPGGATLVVSVGPETDIAFYFQSPDGTRAKGREAWTGTLPHFTGCCFERLWDSSV